VGSINCAGIGSIALKRVFSSVSRPKAAFHGK
jgi:hypothetical protein